ncbi:MAG: competence protein TfoX [Bacteroidetes bacterium GWC2_33_15]|nr:MAG: competence protein TfoX [Bacteroidetes bacterium GWA2_33_15]OFX48623.1 MAG: competence protein TfoX [Bacteroidetes bacterium GWC2_33_15]OFX64597.1 MAG: competence protein TfoX [Bacteroidetes bacterium GWB2_32_14]OFX67985.1 MAG: competence protein TfoX [Bacteroidetes bacterium GWD2_33_33]HAN18219.1 competence protein TfoX [Bacteroidales bacterium]
MTELTSLPNIGKELAKTLQQVGIKSGEELKQVGSENAFIRIKTIDPSACINKLCALEGAVQGIRWHNLSKERKQELKEFLKMVEKNA